MVNRATINMCKLLFFAKLREELACSELSIALSEPLNDRESLIAAIAEHVKLSLGSEKAELFRQKLSAPNIVMAVNHKVCQSDVMIQPDDEVAFYPPVTGG